MPPYSDQDPPSREVDRAKRLEALALRYTELWREQMSALVSDPKMAEAAARFFSGLGQGAPGSPPLDMKAAFEQDPMSAFAQMAKQAMDEAGANRQTGAPASSPHGKDDHAEQPASTAEHSSPTPGHASPAGAASDDPGAGVDDIARRIAELEQRLRDLGAEPSNQS